MTNESAWSVPVSAWRLLAKQNDAERDRPRDARDEVEIEERLVDRDESEHARDSVAAGKGAGQDRRPRS